MRLVLSWCEVSIFSFLSGSKASKQADLIETFIIGRTLFKVEASLL